MPGVILMNHTWPWTTAVAVVVQQAGVWGRKRYIPKPILLAIQKLLKATVDVKT